MSAAGTHAVSPWADAQLAAALFSVDPAGTGGVLLRALPGPVRERWLALLRDLLPPAAPLRRVPLHITDGRLLGGLDLAATLRAGRPVAERGLLAEADGGVLLLAMAERLTPATAAHLGAALDAGVVRVERDGLALRLPARLGVIALDEGIAQDERPPAALLDRLAIHLDLGEVGMGDAVGPAPGPREVAAAGARLPAVQADAAMVEALCAAALALGIYSIRAPLLALKVARAVAALAGRDVVAEPDVAVAGRLVLAPRATVLPGPPSEEDAAQPVPTEAAGSSPGQDGEHAAPADGELEHLVLAAAQAAIPAGLLAQLRLAGGGRERARATGRAGTLQRSALRGRPAGVGRGEPRGGARLSLVETLRAAAPWQPLRRRDADPAGATRVEVRRDDLRIIRFKHRAQTTTSPSPTPMPRRCPRPCARACRRMGGRRRHETPRDLAPGASRRQWGAWWLRTGTPAAAPLMSEHLSWERDGRDWPNRAASRFVRAAGFCWHVQQMGEGPDLLLVHGTGAATHSWRGLAPLLARRFTVVAPDLPGHGFTETPPPGGLSLPGMAAALGELLGTLGVHPVLAAGHSAGAAILARMSLDRVIAPAGLVSLNGALLPLNGLPGTLFAPLARLLALTPLVPRLFAWRAADRAMVERMLKDTGSTLEPAGVELYGRLARNPGHVAAALGMMASWELHNLERDLPGLEPRLLLVVGGNDRTIPPAHALRVKRLVPGAAMVTLAGLGHLAHEERPDTVAELVVGFACDTGVLPKL